VKAKTAFIVDDERLARDGLLKKLEEFSEINVIGEAKNIAEAVDGVNKLKPEILFLDIQLSDGTGFDLLNKIEYTGKVIFVTAYDEYAIRAFEINALDYIVKPISDERLKSAIQRSIENNEAKSDNKNEKLKSDDRLMVNIRNSIHFVKINTIVIIEASGDYTKLITDEGKSFLTSRNMYHWEERLPEQIFLRVHRSFIINFEYIEKTQKYSHNTALIYLQGIDEPIKLSRSYYKKIKGRYM